MAKTKNTPVGAGLAPAQLAPDKQTAQPTTAIGPRNQTTYKNEPLIGGQQANVMNALMLRAPIRNEIQIDDFMSSLRAAEMRYNPNRIRLYDLILQALLDAQLTGVLNKRTLSVLNQTVYYTDAKGEELTGPEADTMNAFINSDAFRFIGRMIMEKTYWGISGLEALPGKEIRFSEVPRKHIKPHNQIISVEQNMQEYGFDYTKLDNVWILDDNPEDLGILPQLAILVIYKRGALADWANFIEIFGMPVRVVKYDPFDPNTEAKLSQQFEEDGNISAVLIPNTAEFDILDGKTGNANGDLQEKFVKYLDDQIAILTLGNTETTGNSGTGSQAKSKTHAQQQKEILKSDILNYENKLNHPQLTKILKSYLLPLKDGGRFKVKSEIDVVQAAQEVVIYTTLAAAGLKIPESFLYDTFNIPEPGAGDQVLTAPQPPAPMVEDGDKELNMDDMPITKSQLHKLLNDFFA